MNQRLDDQIRDKMQELNELISHFEETADPAAQAAMKQIVQTLLEFHAAGIGQIMRRIQETDPQGQKTIESLIGDKLVSSLLLLHDLHPEDLPTRVQRALDRAQPYLASHGGHVDLVSVNGDGIVRIRLEGSCHGCPSSRVTLQSTLEQEIYDAAPEVTSIVVEGLVEEPPPVLAGFVPLDHVGVPGHHISAAAG
jgi:Fe-S cluster biogenesis protein NfuA